MHTSGKFRFIPFFELFEQSHYSGSTFVVFRLGFQGPAEIGSVAAHAVLQVRCGSTALPVR